MKPSFVLLVVVGMACSRPASDAKGDSTKKSAPLTAVDSTFELVCGTPSKPVPFTRIDLGPAGTTTATRDALSKELIQTADEWKQRWRAFGEPTTPPALNFQDSVLVVVASPMLSTGPSSYEIEGVAKCIATDDLVIPVRLHSDTTTKEPTRSIRAVQIARSEWQNHNITFYDMPPIAK